MITNSTWWVSSVSCAGTADELANPLNPFEFPGGLPWFSYKQVMSIKKKKKTVGGSKQLTGLYSQQGRDNELLV